jgi:hypothetical protein
MARKVKEEEKVKPTTTKKAWFLGITYMLNLDGRNQVVSVQVRDYQDALMNAREIALHGFVDVFTGIKRYVMPKDILDIIFVEGEVVVEEEPNAT